MSSNRSLIEDYLPIEAISAEASREKSVRKGHISTLHLWWARRPLVACRAAVYGALVSASRFIPENGPDNKKQSLGRANAAKFVERLCKYPGNPTVIEEGQRHILEAHAERLIKETGKKVTVEDIEQGRAPRPKVLDMFAGGGAIPLEALRLGCEAYAMELNPVAYVIELCTLVYPQKYGKPDPNAQGMTGPKNAKGEISWGGLANEVRYWGEWVLKKVRAEIGDLYPLIPDPEFKGERPVQAKMWQSSEKIELPPGYVVPVAYLWTRTVRCKNPSCGAIVPLVKQTWLCKKKGRYVAMKMVASNTGVLSVEKKVRFEVIEATTEKGLGFDPAEGSKGGNATCPFCGTVADTEYVMREGIQQRFGQQLMAVAYRREESGDLQFLQPENKALPKIDQDLIEGRLKSLSAESAVAIPNVNIDPTRPSPNARGLTAVTRYGLARFSDLFTRRQLLFLSSCVKVIRSAEAVIEAQGIDKNRSDALLMYLGVFLDRNVLINTTMARWRGDKAGRVEGAFGRHALTMIWDFPEINPFGGLSNDAWSNFLPVLEVIQQNGVMEPAEVLRGTATAIGFANNSLDAIITDPPYYDNVPYADISDFFYVWLRQAIGRRFPEHFAGELTPKKNEITALASRYSGDMQKAMQAYESMMAQSFREAYRSLKEEAPLVIVYAHKTTLGWATLVEALKDAGFEVTEAWPLDTEMGTRLIAMESAALASSIFLVARKRQGSATGSYENVVHPELERIVRERVDSLWKMGITGADLVIAAVGAGLRAFTRFSRVEYANGEEVLAEKFLGEVEGVVLDTMMTKLFGITGGNVSAIDTASRFYVLWRFVYKTAEIDAGEAIVFTYSQHVEIDGSNGLSAGNHALIEKKKSKYQARDFTERGHYDKLGLTMDNGQPASLIDVLHRILWLIENSPRKLAEFLDEARPDRERLRIVAQTLAGAGLSGKSEQEIERLVSTTPAEQAALGKLLANWRNLIESQLVAAEEGLFGKMGR